jgi:hypothetical protein
MPAKRSSIIAAPQLCLLRRSACPPNQPPANREIERVPALIRHIVLFSAKSAQDIDTILTALLRLRQIPGARRLEVVRNAKLDQLSGEIDIIVHGEFADSEALARYKAHPIYQETIAIVRPLRDLRIAVDYLVPEQMEK